MSIANPIKFFHSGMQGAPSMTNAFGDMIAVLDACLVNGFNSKVIASITSAGGIATATITAGHLYAAEQVVLIAGCDQAEYNGDQRINWINATQFQFPVSGTPASPATTATSMTVKASPLGFQKAFAGTNKAAYRSQNALSPKNYLRVDNATHTGWVTGRQIQGKVTIGRTMTDVDTFSSDYAPYSSSNSFPDWGWFKWHQSEGSNSGTATVNNGATASTWVLVGDDRAFYFLVGQGAGGFGARRMYGFGDLESFKVGDVYGTFLWAADNYNEAGTASDPVPPYGPQCGSFGPANGQGQLLFKAYTGVGGSVGVAKISLGTFQDVTNNIQSGYNTGISWPNGPDQAMVIHPAYALESAAHLRGTFPGLYCIHNNMGAALGDLTVVDSVVNYSGRKFLAVSVSRRDSGADGSPRVLFDLTGPWRS